MKAKKAYLAAALAVTMLFGTVACASTNKQPAPAAQPATNATTETKEETKEETNTADVQTATADDIMTPYGRYPETLVMTTAKRSSSQPNFVAGEDVENNAMTKYILDKVNVQIKVDWEVEGAEFPNKLALMLTSGSLPDMFTLGAGDYLLYRQLVENDLLADLKPGYDACASDYMKNAFATYEGRNLQPFEEDGKLLALAGGRYGYEHNLAWIRTDWLEKAGMSAPKTVADIEALLTAWKNNPPVENYAGLVLNAKYVAGVYDMYSSSPIMATFGAYPGAWVKDDKGEVIWGSTAPQVKEGLAVLADWYSKGLIDKQFATRTAGGATDALVTGGQAGFAFVPWWYVYTIGDFPKNFPEAKDAFNVYNTPVDANGKYNIMFPGAAGDYIMVRKGYSNPEAIYKVINCEFDMWRQFDEEGGNLIKPNRDNNVSWTYMFPTSGFNIEPSTCIPDIGKLSKAYVETGSDNGVDPGNPMNVDMALRAMQYSKDHEVTGMNWIDYYGRYVASNMMTLPEVVVHYPEYYFVTESMADLKPNLETLEQTTFLKIVTGELPVDAFDKFVSDWYAQGGQTMTDEVRAMVAAQ